MEGPLKSSSRTSGRAENVAPNRLTGQCPLNGGSSVDAKNAAVIQTGGVGLPRGSEKKNQKSKRYLCYVEYIWSGRHLNWALVLDVSNPQVGKTR